VPEISVSRLFVAAISDKQDMRISPQIHLNSALPQQLRPLIILDSPELSGPAKGLLQILSVMAANSIDPLVVNFRYAGRTAEFSDQARAQGTTVIEVEQRSRLDWTFLADIVASATRHGVNLVQSHTFKANLTAMLIRRRTGWPWVAFAHGYTQDRWRARLYNRADQLLMRKPDHVCAVAESVASIVRWAGRRGPISIVPNAIEAAAAPPNFDKRSELRRSFGLAPNEFVIACLGRLSREKGVDVLLSAARELVAEVPETRIVVAGDGPEGEVLRREASQPALAGHVRFLGRITRPQELMGAADLVVLPSRSEGLPNVVLESYEVGTPVLATNVGAVGQIILEGKTGWIIQKDNVTALLAGLRRTAAARTDLPRYGMAGRDWVLDRFSIARRMAALDAVYASLLPK
jgi:glycosyltransferase involved in cell wall biosynthesis